MNSVVEYVSKWAKEMPDKVAVVYGKVQVTYRGLYEKSVRYSRYLTDNGVRKGKIVITIASQDYEYAIIYLAVHLSGAAICSVGDNMSSDAVGDIALKVNADYILSDEEIETNYVLLRRDVQLVLEEYRDVSLDGVSFPDENDLADILFTTGTTGSSKGVMLSHKALVATANNLIYGCKYNRDTAIVTPGPLNHANAIRKLFTTFVNGSTIIILNGMKNLKRFYDSLEYTEGRMACCLPPAMIRTLFTLTGDKLGEYKDKIDFIESATSPLPEADKEHLASLLPNTRLYNNYGSSEAASVCIFEYSKYKNECGCIGKAMPNSEVFIVNDNKERIEATKDKPRLIACKGDVVMMGYINEPELTKEVFSDGVVYTNDIGYKDGDFIYIVGRKGDVINLGGLKIAPAEVESVALYYPEVKDCILVPILADGIVVSTKILLVVDDPDTFNKKEFTKFLGKKLEPHKVPQKVEFTDAVKKTFNGKIDRKAYI